MGCRGKQLPLGATAAAAESCRADHGSVLDVNNVQDVAGVSSGQGVEARLIQLDSPDRGGVDAEEGQMGFRKGHHLRGVHPEAGYEGLSGGRIVTPRADKAAGFGKEEKIITQQKG